MFLVPGSRAHLKKVGPTGATGPTGTGATGAQGAQGVAGSAGSSIAPTRTVYLSSSGQYVTKANCKAIIVRAKGAGGSATSAGGGAPTASGNTTFGSLTARAGGAGLATTQGAGGVATGGDFNRTGAVGGITFPSGEIEDRFPNSPGGMGGGGVPADSNAPVNSGFGAGGATDRVHPFQHQNYGSCGGGEGGYVEKLFSGASLAVAFLYNVGAPGVPPASGHTGGSGWIIIDEFY